MSGPIIPLHPSISSYAGVTGLKTKLQRIQAQLASETKNLSSSDLQELEYNKTQHRRCELGLKSMDKGIKFADNAIEILTSCLQDIEQMSEHISEADKNTDADVMQAAENITTLNMQMNQRLEMILDAASNKLTRNDLNVSFDSVEFGKVRFKLQKVDTATPQATFTKALGGAYTAAKKYDEMLAMVSQMRASILQACKVLGFSKQSMETDIALLNQQELVTTAKITELTHLSEEELSSLADTIKALIAQIMISTSIIKQLNEFHYQELSRISESLR